MLRSIKYISKMLFAFAVFAMIFNLAFTAPVRAQSSTEDQFYIGFKSCDFKSLKNGSESSTGQNGAKVGEELFKKCIKEITTFIFVIAIFFIFFRVAIAGLDRYNPFSNNEIANSTPKVIGEVLIGLLLIGAPGILIATINPAALSVNIFDLNFLSAQFGQKAKPIAGPGPGGAIPTTTIPVTPPNGGDGGGTTPVKVPIAMHNVDPSVDCISSKVITIGQSLTCKFPLSPQQSSLKQYSLPDGGISAGFAGLNSSGCGLVEDNKVLECGNILTGFKLSDFVYIDMGQGRGLEEIHTLDLCDSDIIDKAKQSDSIKPFDSRFKTIEVFIQFGTERKSKGSISLKPGSLSTLLNDYIRQYQDNNPCNN